MTEYAEAILAAYNDKLTKIVLPESGKGLGFPDVIWARAFTINDRKRINKVIEDNEAEAMLRVVTSHCRDETGARLFDEADKYKVGAAPAWLINHIATAILASMSDFESELEK